MSLKRAAKPLTTLLRTLPTTTPSRARIPITSQPCHRCLQSLSQRSSSIIVHRRHQSTATAYQPHTLDTTPPPRNANIPDTSIAGTQPQSNPSQHLTPQLTPPPSQYPPNASISEAEAQIPRPTPQSPTTGTTTPTTSKPRRSKLRARKAAMSLTPAAVHQLRELLDQPTPQLIRVGVKNRGCSGLAYHLEYVDKAGAFDESVDQDGVQVLVDSKALFSIIGSEMDWVEDKLSRRFVFRNPNITEQCGCGESFSIS